MRLLELENTDKNAIRFMILLTGFLVSIGIGRVLGDWTTAFLAGVVGTAFIVLAALAATGLYEEAMKDSLPVLKVSLVIAVILSFFGAVSATLAALIAAVVFTISPVFYDFMRDVIVPNQTRDTPWHERETGVKVLEIFAEAILGAIISIVIALALTGHV